MKLGAKLMEVIVKVRDVVELAKRFEKHPREAMLEVTQQMQKAFASTLERLMDAEIELFLGNQKGNKRNGYRERKYTIKGIGTLNIKVPRDRKGKFESNIVPSGRRYDVAIEKDLALLNLSGLSTRMLSLLSREVLGIKVSSQEISNSLKEIVPSAKAFLERSLKDRKFKYLYVDGTNFSIRRSTVDKEPTLVVIGVDLNNCKSVIAAISGDKDSKQAWEMVFSDLKSRGLETSSVQLGIMDGLPGLDKAFKEAFPRAQVARCWVHKARNVFPRVPKRYQAAFKEDWNKMQYSTSRSEAYEAYKNLKNRWIENCPDAVKCISNSLDELLVHYEYPTEHWPALRTTNPIERVNKEFKRRSKSMEVLSDNGLKALLAFTALKLEYGWSTTPITSSKMLYLKNNPMQKLLIAKKENQLEVVNSVLLN